MSNRACGVCGFDPSEYDRQDALGTLRSFDARWAWTLEGWAVERADLLPEPPVSLSPAEFSLPADHTALLDAVHQGSHRLVTVARARAVAAPVTGEGAVAFVSVSGGGAPKRPLERATIGRRGLASDRQAERRHHGRPWQAVSLWSVEVIERLAADGHPIAAGCAGENLTVQGLDWVDMRPGVRLAVGKDVVIELTAYAAPCHKIAGCFLGGDFNCIDHDRHPGMARLYASVLQTGEVVPGDTVIVEPGLTGSKGAH